MKEDKGTRGSCRAGACGCAPCKRDRHAPDPLVIPPATQGAVSRAAHEPLPPPRLHCQIPADSFPLLRGRLRSSPAVRPRSAPLTCPPPDNGSGLAPYTGTFRGRSAGPSHRPAPLTQARRSTSPPALNADADVLTTAASPSE
ncbi:hypothetical protein CALCODRAFT_57720 [Calocera cornea HHB12733]|uniref:Uncharacterized protein n=1 Tax=Calocera cornea HHB12733 TaxID=1353952 RepID=A0A165IV32_9BASI|nr:hypothetical protein CALCODRAFT_57720 [Calocera cornea HHB12733]